MLSRSNKRSLTLILFVALGQGCGNSQPADSGKSAEKNTGTALQAAENPQTEGSKNSPAEQVAPKSQSENAGSSLGQTIEFVNNFNEETAVDENLHLDTKVLIALVDPEKEGVPDAIRQSADEKMQRKAILILNKTGQSDLAIPELITAATYSKNSRVCGALDKTLRQLQPAKIVQPIVEQLSAEWDHLLRKSPPDILRAIVMDLGHHDLNYLLKVIDRETDAIPEVRDFVTLAAANAGPKAKVVVPELIELLTPQRFNFAASPLLVPEALVKIGADDPQTVGTLTKIVSESKNKKLQKAAFDALKKLNPEAAVNSGFLDEKK
ncbi:hypothetical protein [Thalassoglobus polymorphus]|uniref:HEAT repeat protein n=1 Tax=Thalassoglobus polymorphus TaxID=2527994 RepID=A0A517QMC4_9PLAN|nr:hypothetical protein [Thalassoglobus polymorphus]QDT32786.1 hypothetical protein Mal48_20330 [Thalassoglobus polymorphus]